MGGVQRLRLLHPVAGTTVQPARSSGLDQDRRAWRFQRGMDNLNSHHALCQIKELGPSPLSQVGGS